MTRICLVLLLLSAPAFSDTLLASDAQCAGTSPTCFPLDDLTGTDPGVLLASTVSSLFVNATYAYPSPLTGPPIGEMISAVFRTTNGSYNFYYQLSLNSSFTGKIAAFAVQSVSGQSEYPYGVAVRTDSLNAYGAAGFSASEIEPLSVLFGPTGVGIAMDAQFTLPAGPCNLATNSCPVNGSMLVPGQTSATLEFTSPSFIGFSTSDMDFAIGSYTPYDGAQSYSGVDVLVAIPAAPAPEPGTGSLLSLPFLFALGTAVKKRFQQNRP